MLRLIGCAVALAAFRGARGAQYEGGCTLQLGVDFRGNDFSNTKKDSAEQCDIPCLEEPRCTHFRMQMAGAISSRLETAR